ncbi:MAG: DNA/RNA nuclease SfsA, partial [Eisenbergiella massiliensis]
RRFTPNWETQPAFAQALERAQEAGVAIYARGCHVTQDSMEISYEIPVVLKPEAKKQECFIQTAKGRSMADRPAVCEADKNENLCDIAQPLLKWYDGHRRVLPWRENPAPYRVWVSEIMLQQTRVEAVKPYFERFMEALPGIPELAQAPGISCSSCGRDLVITTVPGTCRRRRRQLWRNTAAGCRTAGKSC